MFLNDSCSDTEHPPGDSDGAVEPGGPHNRHFLPIKEELSSQDGFYKAGNVHQSIADLPGKYTGLGWATNLLISIVTMCLFRYAYHRQNGDSFFGIPLFEWTASARAPAILGRVQFRSCLRQSHFESHRQAVFDAKFVFLHRRGVVEWRMNFILVTMYHYEVTTWNYNRN